MVLNGGSLPAVNGHDLLSHICFPWMQRVEGPKKWRRFMTSARWVWQNNKSRWSEQRTSFQEECRETRIWKIRRPIMSHRSIEASLFQGWFSTFPCSLGWEVCLTPMPFVCPNCGVDTWLMWMLQLVRVFFIRSCHIFTSPWPWFLVFKKTWYHFGRFEFIEIWVVYCFVSLAFCWWYQRGSSC